MKEAIINKGLEKRIKKLEATDDLLMSMLNEHVKTGENLVKIVKELVKRQEWLRKQLKKVQKK
ncbi:MAG: hypothetical protein Q7R87_01495 [Nanoarchaeota archaeon]|nr:hypothetical protein [Nanoarchaeota archaeon]